MVTACIARNTAPAAVMRPDPTRSTANRRPARTVRTLSFLFNTAPTGSNSRAGANACLTSRRCLPKLSRSCATASRKLAPCCARLIPPRRKGTMAKSARTERTPPLSHRRTAQARLTKALSTLTQPDGNNGASQNATVTELCRLAGVSRNSLYRYHTDILKALRKHQCRRPSAADSKARRSDEQRRLENLALQERISQLAALVDGGVRVSRWTPGETIENYSLLSA